MSFILDALRKSETERQQQSSAEFASVATSTGPASVPRWLWIVGLLLLINIAVLIGLLVRSDNDSAQTTPPRVAAVESQTPEHQQNNFANQVTNARKNVPQRQAEEVTASRTASQTPIVKPVIISQDPAAIRSREIYPTIQEVRASGTSGLPDLHLDIHVYSEAPEDRFVFINMSKYREGSQLDEGPVIAEITPQGVILGHRGASFLLPRE